MIAIIGAMEEEVRGLHEQMDRAECIEKAGCTFFRGTLFGRDAVVVSSGVGKVNAASCTQMVIDLFEPECVINTGIAGALAPELSVGDIVISTDAVQHDVDTTVFGDAPGQIPDMEVYEFPADDRLVDAAVFAVQKLMSERTLTGKAMSGRILSGDIFLTDRERKLELRETFNGSCVEMEGAAIAQVAYLNQVPWIILRCISDQADNPAAVDYLTFKKEAIRISTAMVAEMLQVI